MNTPLFCALSLLAADPVVGTRDPIDSFHPALAGSLAPGGPSDVVVRAQGDPFYGGGGTPPTYAPPGGISPIPPTNPGTFDPFAGGAIQPFGAPMTGDPFLGGTAAPAPYGYDPFSQPPTTYTFGLNGPQPFRYGWQARYDFGFLPSEGTSNPDVGSLSITAADFEKELNTPVGAGYTASIAPQFNLRFWDGPLGTPGMDAGLPGEGYRFGLGLKLATPAYGAWQFEGGFTPALATDFSDVNSDAWLFDAHAVAFYRASPQWMFAIGAAYWDRVDNIVLPYAGVVWTPNDYWEFRLLFPKPRISWFVGAPWGAPTWLYAAGEYHVEAYEVNVDPINQSTRVQFEDWRLVGGARSEFGAVTGFVEAGWVFERSVDFRAAFATDFDVNDGFILRAGFRY